MSALTDDRLQSLAHDWANGTATLKDLRGYTEQELYSIARIAYVYFHEGRLDDAHVLFQGLAAVDPLDRYFAGALAVVELAAGNSEAALAAWDAAIELAPDDPSGWLGRGEVWISSGDQVRAAGDLQRARSLAPHNHPLRRKIDALLRAVTRP